MITFEDRQLVTFAIRAISHGRLKLFARHERVRAQVRSIDALLQKRRPMCLTCGRPVEVAKASDNPAMASGRGARLTAKCHGKVVTRVISAHWIVMNFDNAVALVDRLVTPAFAPKA